MDDRYAAALAGWELAFVRTVSEAREALAAARRDLVAIGVYFDDSRMFDLVRALRSEDALKALAADEFIDLVQFGEDDSGNAALRAAVDRLLSR